MYRRGLRRRRRLGALAVLLIVVSLLLTAESGPVSLVPPVASASDVSTCAALVSRLPGTLDGRDSRQVSPASPLTAAWGRPAITLRCGLPAVAHPVSAGSVCLGGAPITCVGGLTWYEDVFIATLWVTRVAPRIAVRVPSSDGLADVLHPITAAALGR